MAEQALSLEEAASGLLVLPDSQEGATEEQQEQEAAEDQTQEEESEALAEAEEDEASVDEDQQESDEQETEGEDEEEQPLYAVKVNGKEHEVTLDELTRGYSRQRDYDEKTAALKADRAQFEEAQGAAVEEFRKGFERLNEAIASMDDGLSKYADVDWDALEEQDPEEAARLDRQYRRDIGKREKAVEKAQELAKEQRARVLASERPKLLRLIPEWQDQSVMKEEGGKIAAWAQATYGFSNDDLNSVTMAAHTDLLRKAWLYDEGQKAKPKKQEILKKKVAGKPKVVKSGSTRSRKASNSEAYAEKVNRARRKGATIHEAASAMADLLNKA